MLPFLFLFLTLSLFLLLFVMCALRSPSEASAVVRLQQENEILKKRVQDAKEKLRQAEVANGKSKHG